MFDVLAKIYKKYENLFQGKFFYAFILFYKYQRVMGVKKALFYILKKLPYIKVYSGKNKADSIYKLLSNVDIRYDGARYYYFIDECKCLKLKGKIIGNCPIEYDKFLSNGLKDLYGDDKNENKTIDAILMYVDRIIDYLKNECNNKKDINAENIINWLSGFKEKSAKNIDEALQRILIINMIQHQTNHTLVGLGRLSVTLCDYIDDVPDENVSHKISIFLRLLHNHYVYKSHALMGDTGQIIILGGDVSDKNLNIDKLRKIDNIILDAMMKEKLSDPKPLIRLDKNSPDDMYEKIINHLKCGIGSPLIANDDVIVPCLVNDGYDKSDAIDYCTSACWEPLPRYSYEQNNIVSIDMSKAFDIISKNAKDIYDFDNLMQYYYKDLEKIIDEDISYVESIMMEEDPLYDLASKSKYHNYGLLTVGMGNVVDSLLNIKNIVFDDKKYTYSLIDNMRKKNYAGADDVYVRLKNMKKHYGIDDEGLKLTNDIINHIYEYTKDYKNKYGGHVKYGLSSPHYIMNSKKTCALYDGKKKGEPFNIHISCDGNNSYTELANFASKIDYNKRFYNGDVVDIVIGDEILANKEKFIDYIKTCIKIGVCEMQIGVLSSDKLYDAMKNPSEYRSLVVRVWGFNAYYVDLSRDYQEYIYKRALKYEKSA